MDKWGLISNFFLFLTRFSFVQVDDYLYAVGGCNNEGNLTSCIQYNEEKDDWCAVADMPKALR